MDDLHDAGASCGADWFGVPMTSVGEVIKDYWGALVTLVGLIGWLFRVESRGLANEREIKRLSEQRKEDLQNAQRSRDEQSKKLDEMRDDVRDMRQDIKTLLGRGQS